ncbi:cupin domain-containing protein [Kordiimonas sp.]|uniref:cupin domain-containing protein n=1 Tax=Kordiimonas sp. TaxID=1970157 RepID=UPI003A90300F
MEAINLKEKLDLFSDTWTPKIVGNVDDNHVYLAKLEGDFIWHAHDDQDEMFLVVDGRFRLDFRDREVWVEQGEMIVVPKGVEHKPYAPEICSVLIIEKADTDHTGGIDDPLRKENHERI